MNVGAHALSIITIITASLIHSTAISFIRRSLDLWRKVRTYQPFRIGIRPLMQQLGHGVDVATGGG